MGSNKRFPGRFSEAERQAVYDVIYARRDIRGQFRSDPIPPAVLRRILDAAHHAGSVGFMQPWNFLVVRDQATRRRVKEVFQREHERAAGEFAGERQRLYRQLKLEGILESALNVCVTCDRERHGPAVLGRSTMRETDVYSTCCAIQNLWLAARAEGIGVGWVSILDVEAVGQVLQIPGSHQLVAYLCLGYVQEFPAGPELEARGWLKRMPLEQVVFEDRWDTPIVWDDCPAEATEGSINRRGGD